MRKILEEYHHFSIGASQVDIIAHSMGGLMARGFVQQPDYKGKENYTKGSNPPMDNHWHTTFWRTIVKISVRLS